MADIERKPRSVAESEADYMVRLEAERDYALRDAELARERADRTHEQLRGAVRDCDYLLYTLRRIDGLLPDQDFAAHTKGIVRQALSQFGGAVGRARA